MSTNNSQLLLPPLELSASRICRFFCIWINCKFNLMFYFYELYHLDLLPKILQCTRELASKEILHKYVTRSKIISLIISSLLIFTWNRILQLYLHTLTPVSKMLILLKKILPWSKVNIHTALLNENWSDIFYPDL